MGLWFLEIVSWNFRALPGWWAVMDSITPAREEKGLRGTRGLEVGKGLTSEGGKALMGAWGAMGWEGFNQ